MTFRLFRMCAHLWTGVSNRVAAAAQGTPSTTSSSRSPSAPPARPAAAVSRSPPQLTLDLSADALPTRGLLGKLLGGAGATSAEASLSQAAFAESGYAERRASVGMGARWTEWLAGSGGSGVGGNSKVTVTHELGYRIIARTVEALNPRNAVCVSGSSGQRNGIVFCPSIGDSPFVHCKRGDDCLIRSCHLARGGAHVSYALVYSQCIRRIRERNLLASSTFVL